MEEYAQRFTVLIDFSSGINFPPTNQILYAYDIDTAQFAKISMHIPVSRRRLQRLGVESYYFEFPGDQEKRQGFETNWQVRDIQSKNTVIH